MLVLFYCALILAGLVALILLVGAFLPKSHVATRSAIFRQPIQRVFEIIAGPPDWRPDLEGYEILPSSNGRSRWRERWRRGRTVTIERTDFDPPHRIATRIVDTDLPFTGGWTQELKQVQEGTLIRVTETGDIYNPLFRFLARFVFGHHTSMEKYLRALGRQLGEQPRIEP